MSDRVLRTLERDAATQGTDEALLALRYARIRHGLEDVPEHWSGLVLDPLHLVQMQKSVAKINKMLRKKGGLPLELVESPQAEYIERMRASDGATVRIKVRQVALYGDMPGAEGRYRFAARLHHLPDATIIHRSRAAADLDDSVLEAARLAGPQCQHCDKRRGRHDTFIVIDTEQGTTLQVGSSCLNKYTSEDCSLVLYAFDKLRQLTEELDSGDLDDAPVEEYGCSPLAFLSHYIRLDNVGPKMTREHRSVRAQQNALLYGLTPKIVWVDVDADIMAAMDLLHRAETELLPGLKRHREAQAEGTVDQLQLLTERDHNIATILESGTISSREAATFGAIFAWEGEAAQRTERERMRLLATDPKSQAAEMATLIGPEASITEGGITLSPATLARLLLGDNEPALLSLATIISNPQALATPAHDGEYLAAPGVLGTWMMTVTAIIPYSSGGGSVIKLSHRGVDGKSRQATVFAGGHKLAELGWSKRDTVEVRATVNRHDNYKGKPGVIFDLS